jgi:hypothetical protein
MMLAPLASPARRVEPQPRDPIDHNGANAMPLCVYLCYTHGCEQKVERWYLTPDEGRAARIECPRCGEPMRCAWTGSQAPTPNMKDAVELEFKAEG